MEELHSYSTHYITGGGIYIDSTVYLRIKLDRFIYILWVHLSILSQKEREKKRKKRRLNFSYLHLIFLRENYGFLFVNFNVLCDIV